MLTDFAEALGQSQGQFVKMAQRAWSLKDAARASNSPAVQTVCSASWRVGCANRFGLQVTGFGAMN